MGKEIEKKYLIRENGIEHASEALLQMYNSVEALKKDVLQNGKSIRQGYLPLYAGLKLSDKLGMNADFDFNEARLRDKAGKFYFTLKGSGGLSRNELETKIEQEVFDEYWPMTKGNRVEKVRLNMPFEGHTLEIDVYTDRDLIIAEVEVPTTDAAKKLSSLGKDVTTNKTYKNKNLAK